MAASVISWEDVEEAEVFPGIFRQATVSESSMLVRYVYHPGCVFPVHSHPEEQITVC